MKRIKNIGIFAHVDAGKTTLTEQLLYQSGAIRHLGRVDHGDTHTDTMDLERERGISIVSQPISFDYHDLKVNLIDTPGHVDFVAEVERSIMPLDAAILVISAKESVQSHTRTLFQALKNQDVPVLVVVNKIDRMGINLDKVNQDLKQLLKTPVALNHPTHVGTKEAKLSDFVPLDRHLLETLAEMSEDALEAYCAGVSDANSIQDLLKNSIKTKTVYPVIYMSAMHGIGVKACLDVINEWLPEKEWPIDEPLGGLVFKVLSNHVKTRSHYVKLTAGHIGLREVIGQDKVTSIMALKNGKLESTHRLYAGDIGLLTGLSHYAIGDTFGSCSEKAPLALAQPTLRVKVEPLRPSMRGAMLLALETLAASDPYLTYQLSEVCDAVYMHLFGYVQLDILKEQLLRQYDVEVNFGDPSAIYMETPKGVGEYRAGWGHEGMPYPVGVGIRVEPLPLGSGLVYASEITTGFLKQTYQNGIRDGVYAYSDQGLMGWELTDMKVTLIDFVYDSVMSTVSHYRDLTPIVLFEALKQVGTQLLWPVGTFSLEVPLELMGKATSDLARMGASIESTHMDLDSLKVTGTIPLVNTIHYTLDVRAYTSGRGYFETRHMGYEVAPQGHSATRDMFKVNPANRSAYLMHKSRIT